MSAPKMDAKKDLMYLLLFLGGLFLIWMFTGGPARYESAKPLLKTNKYNEKIDQQPFLQ